MRRKIFIILTILWMGVIFLFSAQTAEESTEVSNSVGLFVGRVIIPEFEDWDVNRQLAFAEAIEYPVRKCAHASEYAILGMLLWGALMEKSERKTFGTRRKLQAVLLGVLYACSDEWHQTFVPGRSGQITDVLIDSAGVLSGVLLGALWTALWARAFVDLHTKKGYTLKK